MTRRFKVVLIGGSHCGKTSLTNRYVNGQFTSNTLTTTQAAYYEKRIQTVGYDCFLDVWDTAGQERFHALTPMFYRDAEGALVVFDITDANSFTVSKKWVSELRQARGSDCYAVLVGNKSDLQSQRTVPFDDAKSWADSQKMEYFETSAKTGSNVEQAFMALVKKLTAGKGGRKTTGDARGKRKTASVRFDEPPPEEQRGGCC